MGKAKKISVVHYIICAAFCLLFRFVPGFAGITQMGMGILGSFIGAIYGWMTIGTLWPSAIGLLGMGLSIGMNKVMAAGFGNETFTCLVFCMLVVGIGIENGAFNWLAMKVLSNKFLEGKPYVILFAVFIMAWLTGSFNPIIMCVIFCAFMTSIFEQVHIKKDDPLVVFTFLGIAYQLMSGQILFPFFGTSLVLIGAYNTMFPQIPMDMTAYLEMMIIVGLIMAAVFLALMKFVFRVDVSPLANYRLEGTAPVATKGQKYALILFVIFLVGAILSNLSVPIVSPILKKFGVLGLSLLLGCLAVLLKDENGEPLAKMDELLRMADWGLLTMMAYIMTLSAYMNTPETGIGTAMGYLFQPFINLPPIVFIIVVMVIATLLTNVANNVMVAVVCMPFLANFASLVGLSPVGMVILVFIISEFALATPGASPVTAVAFSQEYVSSGAMTKAALKILPFLFVVFLVIAWPLVGILF